VDGEVGSGKSTFVDFYLRSFCATHSVTKDRFKEKLIINIDFRAVHSAGEFQRRFFERTRTSLETAFRLHGYDIETLDTFAMWHRLCYSAEQTKSSHSPRPLTTSWALPRQSFPIALGTRSARLFRHFKVWLQDPRARNFFFGEKRWSVLPSMTNIAKTVAPSPI